MNKTKYCEIARQFVGAGTKGVVLGKAIECNGMSWTPVLWDGEEDPDWFKTYGLLITTEK